MSLLPFHSVLPYLYCLSVVSVAILLLTFFRVSWYYVRGYLSMLPALTKAELDTTSLAFLWCTWFESRVHSATVPLQLSSLTINNLLLVMQPNIRIFTADVWSHICYGIGSYYNKLQYSLTTLFICFKLKAWDFSLICESWRYKYSPAEFHSDQWMFIVSHIVSLYSSVYMF